MAVILAGDEAGDAGFSFEKGASTHFVMAFVRTRQPEVLREEIEWFKNEQHLSANYEFKFHDTTSRRLRERFFKMLAQSDVAIWALVVDKRLLPDPFRVMGGIAFYLFFLSELIHTVPEADRTGAILVLDVFGRPGKITAELGRVLKARRISRGFRKIKAKRSKGEPLIQCADMVAGALLRKISRGDDTWWRNLWSRPVHVLEYRAGQEKPPS